LHFVNKDLNEKNIRMTLNYGHTFAHAIEANNKFSKKINHGEAVLIGMIMATKLSVIKKVTAASTLEQLKEIYFKNNLNYNLEKIFKKKEYTKIINFMANDKKNNDNKINLILLKKIGIPSKPGNYKFSFSEIRRIFPKLTKI
jgi:3-dehydroquinate synthetase